MICFITIISNLVPWILLYVCLDIVHNDFVHIDILKILVATNLVCGQIAEESLVWYEENPERNRCWRNTYIYAYIRTFFNRKIGYVRAITGNSKVKVEGLLPVHHCRAPVAAVYVVNDWRRRLVDKNSSVELSSFMLFVVRAFSRHDYLHIIDYLDFIFDLLIFSLTIFNRLGNKYIYIYSLFDGYISQCLSPNWTELLVCVNLIFLHRDNVRRFVSEKREKFNEFPLFYIYNYHMLLLRLGWFCW